MFRARTCSTATNSGGTEVMNCIEGFEVLRAVIMRNYIIWDILPCSPFESKPTFRRNMSPSFSESKN
jgi:hypothetical protein